MLRAPQWHGASQMHFPPRPRKSAWHCADVIPPHGPPHTRSKRITRYQQSSRSPVARRDTSKSHTSSQSPKRVLRSRRPQTLTLEVRKASVSHETSSKSHTPSLQNERFVRDFLKNSHVKVCKTSVSHKASSKSQAGSSIGAQTSSSPAQQFRDSSPSKQHPLARQSQCHSDIHLYHNSQPHDSMRLPRNFPRPHV